MHSASIRHHIDHDRTWDDGLEVEGEDEVELAAGREYIIRMLDEMRAAMVIQVCRAGEGRAAHNSNFGRSQKLITLMGRIRCVVESQGRMEVQEFGHVGCGT